MRYELDTGETVGRQRHAVDVAFSYRMLAKLLEEDRTSGGTLLTKADRNRAYVEAQELWDALDAPDMTGKVIKWLMEVPDRIGGIKGNLKAADVPAMQRISGTQFDQHGIRAPGPRRGPALAGASGALNVLGFVQFGLDVRNEGLDGAVLNLTDPLGITRDLYAPRYLPTA